MRAGTAGTTRSKSQAGTTRGKSQGLLRRGHSFYLINGRKKPLQRLFSRLRGAAGLQLRQRVRPAGGYDPRQESGLVTARSQFLPHQWSKKAAPAAFFETARSSGIMIAAAGTTRGRVRPAAEVRVCYGEVTVSTSSVVEKSRPSGFFRDCAEQRDYSVCSIKGFMPDRTRCYAAALRGDVLSIRICEIALPQKKLSRKAVPHIFTISIQRVKVDLARPVE